jgi:hypothetical protein
MIIVVVGCLRQETKDEKKSVALVINTDGSY